MTYWEKVSFVYLILSFLSVGLYLVLRLTVFSVHFPGLPYLFFIPWALALACIYFHLGDPAGARINTRILMAVVLVAGVILFAGAFLCGIYLFAIGAPFAIVVAFVQLLASFLIIVGLWGLLK